MIASGYTLCVPRLDRVPMHRLLRESDTATARFASLLLETGIARASDWMPSHGDPLAFVKRTLRRFAEEHGSRDIDDTFDVCLCFSDSPLALFETRAEPMGTRAFLYLEAPSCGFVDLCPVLPILEKAHRRLPATFVALLLDALSRWFRVYDYRDADRHLEYLEEMDDPEGDPEEPSASQNRATLVPPCIQRKPLGRKPLRSLLARLGPQSQAMRLMRAAEEVDLRSRSAEPIRLEPELAELFQDMNPPVPVLLAVFRTGDAIEASFDDEAQYMMEEQPRLFPIFPFDTRDSASIGRAFGCLAAALDTLAAATRLFRSIPGWEPIRREREQEETP